MRPRPVIPVSLATVQFSRSGKRYNSHAEPLDQRSVSAGGEPVSQNSTACEPPRGGCNTRACDLSGPVDMLGRSLEAIAAHKGLPRKEVIQPQLPLRLPCYDFTPVASPTFDGTLLKG